ncbi:MAG: hypothetical protein HYW01_07440 [Deltaproteobacteria bacterium]|nr:hypothetical protein [Deltaproteobacteria bacterium]
MKRRLTLAMALIATSLLLSFMIGLPGKASEEEEINKLIESASTPEDHMKLADYYEKEAEKMEVKSSSHSSIADSYRTRARPLTEHFQLDQKKVYTELAIHCSNLSKEYKEAAEEYRAMAAEHKEMAEEM